MSRFNTNNVNLGKITCIENLDRSFIQNIISNLTATQKFILKVKGSLEIGHFRMAGWTKELPFYLFTCKEHGYQINYPNGHYQKLICPSCIKALEFPSHEMIDHQIEVKPDLIPQI